MNFIKYRVDPRAIDYLIFVLAAAILAAVLYCGWREKSYQSNTIFLTALSLACAITMAYLPITAVFRTRWIRATGAAAIFLFCVWNLVMPAQKANVVSIERELEAAKSETQSVQAQLRDLQARALERERDITTLRQSLEEKTSAQKIAEVLDETRSADIRAAGAAIERIEARTDDAIAFAKAGSALKKSEHSRLTNSQKAEGTLAIAKAEIHILKEIVGRVGSTPK